MQVHEECSVRCDDIERTLTQAEAQWRSLEESLGEEEDKFLTKRLESWKKWFSLDEAELSNWSAGGLRHHVKERTQTLLLAALTERMRAQVGFEPAAPTEGADEAAEPRCSNHVLDALLKHYDKHIKNVVKDARAADEQLAKKIRKTERDERKQGVVALGMRDTRKVAALKRQRPEIWENAQRVVEKVVSPVKRMKEFLKEELPTDKTAGLLAAVPVVVLRAVCDWYFERSLLGYDQLETWWRETKEALQGDVELWRRLKDQERMILRRIDGVMEDIRNGKHNYSLYATFGGNDKEVLNLLNTPLANPDGDIPPKIHDSVLLLVHEVSKMHQRLKAVRDGALWRVVEAAQNIHRELVKEEREAERTPWQAVTQEDGIAALLEVLGIPADRTNEGAEEAGGGDVMDAAVAVMGRLERLGAAAAEARCYFQEEASLNEEVAADVCGLLQGVLGPVAALNEDLLALLDEPLETAVQAWLQQYSTLGSSSKCQKLGAAMAALPLKTDSALAVAERNTRKRWLAFTKGLQAFLGDAALREHVAAPLVATVPGRKAAGAPASPAARAAPQQESRSRPELDVLALATPLSPRLAPSSMASSPFRPPERRRSGGLDSAPSSPVSPATVDSSSPAGPPRHDGAASPSFITPWRPDTPSTTCEEGGAAGNRTPSSKFVDGQLISKRPSTPQLRLPPLSPLAKSPSRGGL